MPIQQPSVFGHKRKFGAEIAPPQSGPQPCRINVRYNWANRTEAVISRHTPSSYRPDPKPCLSDVSLSAE
ncbi:hypothetical protein COMA2_170031 [Candidatus Nitrospira nitrificans]|uniref:Uncharacterized protein n=1 Tax=Candidatus Nitrospira nitrificans TaxID=1742973 RepID=A0A0S4LEX7_9BACT|nr:hypothetical protein COMA2_170031 [Candidatus Nitrospira nitrificans]